MTNLMFEEWLRQALVFFTEMGFFKEYEGSSIEQTIQDIQEYVEENMGYELIHDYYDADLRLLYIDKKRVCLGLSFDS